MSSIPKFAALPMLGDTGQRSAWGVFGDRDELGTGGQAGLIAELSETIEDVEEFLTLQGLRMIFERNRKG